MKKLRVEKEAIGYKDLLPGDLLQFEGKLGPPRYDLILRTSGTDKVAFCLRDHEIWFFTRQRWDDWCIGRIVSVIRDGETHKGKIDSP